MECDLLDNVLCFIMDDNVHECRGLTADQLLTLKISVETAEYLKMRPKFNEHQVTYLKKLVVPYQLKALERMLQFCQIYHEPWLQQWQ